MSLGCLWHNQHRKHNQFLHPNAQAMEQLQENKSAYNALFIYVVFLSCYFPYLCSTILLITNSSPVSFWAAYYTTFYSFSSIRPQTLSFTVGDIEKFVKLLKGHCKKYSALQRLEWNGHCLEKHFRLIVVETRKQFSYLKN